MPCASARQAAANSVGETKDVGPLSCHPRLRRYSSPASVKTGGMAEWLKAHAWKACIRETVSWVRIPLPPPVNKINGLHGKLAAVATAFSDRRADRRWLRDSRPVHRMYRGNPPGSSWSLRRCHAVPLLFDQCRQPQSPHIAAPSRGVLAIEPHRA
jgi:hypothetical protein